MGTNLVNWRSSGSHREAALAAVAIQGNIRALDLDCFARNDDNSIPLALRPGSNLNKRLVQLKILV
jgi:hypothetical protein